MRHLYWKQLIRGVVIRAYTEHFIKYCDLIQRFDATFQVFAQAHHIFKETS
jgi:hypothetical protein